jgi:outer membrane protein assembly factor BamB
VLASTPTGIATIDPAGNNVRWRYAPPAGCTLADSAAGSTGVAVVQRCPGTETVAVQLFDGFSGAVRWTQEVPDTGSVLLSGADALVGVVAGDALLALSTTDGSRLATTALPEGAADDGPLLQTAVGDTALVYAGGSVTAVAAGSGEVRWRLPATGLPVAAPGTGGLLPDVQPAVVVPEADAVVTRDLADGAEIARSTVAGPLPAGSQTAVAGPVVVVRSPDGVTGYR